MAPLSTRLLSRTALVAVAFLSMAGVAQAVNMTEPGTTPPAGSVAAPLNVSINDQIKSGGILKAFSFGSSDGFALGATSGWFVDSSKTTFVAQQYCIGANPNSASGNTCVTSLAAGANAYHFERQIILNIPATAWGYGKPYDDFCQNIAPSGGWIATGSDNCAEYLGDGDNCNGSHKGALLQCTYLRLLNGSTPIAAVSSAHVYGEPPCSLDAQPYTFCADDGQQAIYWTTYGATEFTLQRDSGTPFVVTPASGGNIYVTPPSYGQTIKYIGKVTQGSNTGTCAVTIKHGVDAYCNGGRGGDGSTP